MAKVPELNDIILDFSQVDAMAGVEIVCRSVSLRRASDYDLSADQGVTERAEKFAREIIKSWNYENDHGPIEVSGDALLDMPAWVQDEIYRAWARGLVTAPKGSPI